MSERTPGVNVARASDLMRRTVSFPASISTPADLYSMSGDPRSRYFSRAAAARMPDCSQPRSLLFVDCASSAFRIASPVSSAGRWLASAASATSMRYRARSGSEAVNSRARAATAIGPPATRNVLPAGTPAVRAPPVPTATPIASYTPFPRSSTRDCALTGGAPARTMPARTTMGRRGMWKVLPRTLEIELADERLHQRATRRPLRRIPIGAPREREKALLVEIFLEHVEAFGEQRNRLLPIRMLLERRHHERRRAQRDRAQRQRHRRACRVRRWDADLEQ